VHHKLTKQISWNDFEKIDIRIGTITRADRFPEAHKPAYKLIIDFGDLGEKSSSAQITDLYSPDDLVGRQVAAIVNFPPKKIAGFRSECLVLGAVLESGAVILLGTERETPNGISVL